MRSNCAGDRRPRPGPRMAGDLPPSSSVTGVRWSLAARMTWWPTAVEPVNSRWSNGSRQKRWEKSASPSNTRSSSSAKRASTRLPISAAVCGVSSDSLSMARLPATKAEVSGPAASASG